MTSDRDSPEQQRHHWGAISLAIVVSLALMIVVGSTTGRDGPVAAPTSTRPSSSTSSEGGTTLSTYVSLTTTTLGVEFSNLSVVVPGVTGTLHALVGGEDRQLIRIPSDPDTTLVLPDVSPLGLVTNFGFDRSGRLLGFLEEGQARSGLDRLNVWSDTSMFGFGDLGVTSYQWHEARPRSLAMTTVDATGDAVLRTLAFDDGSLAVEVDTVIQVAEDEAVVGWGEYGFLIGQYDSLAESDVTTLLDQEGNVVWQRKDMTVLDASPGLILALIGRSGEHYLVDPDDPDGLTPLLTLSDGETVTGSDFSSAGRLAVHYPLKGRNSKLRVYDAGFDTFTDFVLEGWRVWDLEWSADERFILMPGTDDRGGHVVIFHDTLVEEIYLFHLNTGVHWAALQTLRG